MSLQQIQEELLAYFLDTSQAPAIPHCVLPAKGLSPGKALEVYRRGYVARLTDALGETFESTWWVLGDELFFETCRSYIETFPSRFYNLTDYGDQFSAFLSTHSASSEFPFLSDLANFEWNYSRVFHGPMPKPATEETIQQSPPKPDCKIRFIEASRLLTSPYPVYEIWKLRKSKVENQPRFDWQRRESTLTYRIGSEMRVWTLTDAQAAILSPLMSGKTLGVSLMEAIESGAELEAEAVQEFFADLFRSQTLECWEALPEST